MIRRFCATLISRTSVYVFVIFMSFIAIAPIMIMWMASLKTSAELYINPLGLPRYWKFENFILAWNKSHLSVYALNSIKVTIPTLVLVLVCASLAGYALAIFRFKGQIIILSLFLLGLMVPSISIITPLYHIMVDMGLHDTSLGLILVETAAALPLSIYLMRSSFLDIPRELRESVLVDGGNDFDVFTRVMLPLARPAVMSVTVLSFLQVWNGYLFPLILINTNELQTMPLALSFLMGRYQTDIVLVIAGTTLISFPTILIYIILQRQFIEGIAEGALK